jgi:hypothetical protein
LPPFGKFLRESSQHIPRLSVTGVRLGMCRRRAVSNGDDSWLGGMAVSLFPQLIPGELKGDRQLGCSGPFLRTLTNTSGPLETSLSTRVRRTCCGWLT